MEFVQGHHLETLQVDGPDAHVGGKLTWAKPIGHCNFP